MVLNASKRFVSAPPQRSPAPMAKTQMARSSRWLLQQMAKADIQQYKPTAGADAHCQTIGQTHELKLNLQTVNKLNNREGRHIHING